MIARPAAATAIKTPNRLSTLTAAPVKGVKLVVALGEVMVVLEPEPELDPKPVEAVTVAAGLEVGAAAVPGMRPMEAVVGAGATPVEGPTPV